MDTVKNRIRRIARILRVVCIVASVALIAGIVATVLMIGHVYLHPDEVGELDVIFGENPLFESLDLADVLHLLPPVHQRGTFLGVGLIELILLLIYARLFKNVMTHISRDQDPFTRETAKRIRWCGYAILLTVVINPIFALTLFLVMLFFSYVFEYGAYLQERAAETNRIQEEVIVSLAEITENKSEQTGQHIKRVSEYSRILARQLGMSDEQVENLRLASTMHDLGKLMIPSEILDKPGRLTDAEFSEIKKHPGFGEHLLHNVEGDTMTLARTVALEHHERYDGRGYPVGEKGSEISLEGRIVAVADVYDALTSRRSYKDAWDPKAAYDEIVRCSGTQFDPEVVNAFVAAYDEIDAARRRYADEQFAGKVA